MKTVLNQHYSTYSPKKSKGNALLLAILVISIVFLMGAALLIISLNSQAGANWFVKKQEAFYLAEAGIEHARVAINETTLPWPQSGTIFVSGNLGNGSYSTFMWDIPGRDNKTFTLIRSHGQIDTYKSIVEATIKVNIEGSTIPEAPGCPCWADTLTIEPYLCQRHPNDPTVYQSLEYWTNATTLGQRFVADARSAPNYKCRTSGLPFVLQEWITQEQYEACATWVNDPYFPEFIPDGGGTVNCHLEPEAGELTVTLENFRQIR